MIKINPQQETLTPEQVETFQAMWRCGVDDILHATSLAACGHPGGSMSSLHFLLMLYAMANVGPDQCQDESRDRILISHGHISPGVYTALAQYGFFDREEMVLNFRHIGSRYSGHIETNVPGVEWNTGNLGQGASAACGFALAGKMKGLPYKTVVCMGDGEQQKGQIAEARRTAVKFGLNNLIAVIDYNEQQIGGLIQDIMPQDIKAGWESDGWNVLTADKGNDFQDLFSTLRKAWLNDVPAPDKPTVILARTEMGYGVSFMQGSHDFHGKACNAKELELAMQELGVPNRLADLQERRKTLDHTPPQSISTHPEITLDCGEPILYASDVKTDNRSAYGKALLHLAELNNNQAEHDTLVGVSCDLEGSVKMDGFHKKFPDHFLECGIQEHSNCVLGGALSKEGFQVFFSTFGVFAISEVYNQQRLNAFNQTNLKTVCTHVGLNVGEDGPTHQNIDYIGLLRNVFNTQVFIPADPNQTDRMVRYVAAHYGNFFVGMGRSKISTVTHPDGTPFFGTDYTFQPGKADIIREGSDGSIITIGPMLEYTLQAVEKLDKDAGIKPRVINFGSVVPADRDAVLNAARETGCLLTVEDHHRDTGIGAIVAEILIDEGVSAPLQRLGVSHFGASGTPDDLYTSQGLDADGIASSMQSLLQKLKP